MVMKRLFGKGNNDDKQEDDKKVNAKVGKKGKKGKKPKKNRGGKKELSLIERMQLEESVAAPTLDAVQAYADSKDSAVRETSEGLLVIAFTNEMLEATGIDVSSEDFGSFSEALKSESIESITLEKDLAQGIVGIIPSQESLLSLDEFDFAHEIAYHWAIVPFGLEDEDGLEILNSSVHIERLIEMTQDENIQVMVRNGEVIESDADDRAYVPKDEYDAGLNNDDDDADYDDNDDFVPEPDNQQDDYDNDYVPDEEVLDIPDEDDDFEPDMDYGDDDEGFDTDSYDAENYDDDGVFDEGIDDSFESDISDDYIEMEEDTTDVLSADESKEAVNRITTQIFNNTELGLTIDMSVFDDYFDSISVAQFDTTRTDDGELQNALSNLRHNANVELNRFRQDNIQSMRNVFTSSMRKIHNTLIETLDHKDEDTTYGERHAEIEKVYRDKTTDIDRVVAGEISKVKAAYSEDREEYAESAKNEAFGVFDSRYRDSRDQKISVIKTNVESDFTIERDTDLGELFNDRRTVAHRLFDKATTTLLQRMQEKYQAVGQSELNMYDAFRKDMDAYLRQHFADEVLRAKAEAEKLKQSHEADRVRQEYEQLLLTKSKQIEEANQLATDGIRQLESTHKEQVDHVRADYDMRIGREQRDNQGLRDQLSDATANIGIISEQKDKEVQHQIKSYQDEIKSKNIELQYANERSARSQKPVMFIIASIAITCLALGIIFGFLYAAKLAPQQVAPAATNNVSVTEYQDSPFAYVIDINDNHIINQG